ncbi:tubulin-specific chaperone cofactor E-like protein isoform X1 [Limanda limanda]|uniref:tubulin-specific chaperone cofactor E-like protein isoform X1 n=2 Tax=Limanda limanda TaxID=27771 RepID=UPI0029C6681D|nr:tubulin-specific chaperone cofactor E-like protein isoform X1 [Limanda limanda]XP_060926303.1 tubulin-specific chaperone cofactor E-like protein isoform X1 [Limanda limanda]XP_060926304.1 tubulin-specific chaperone cofactor E-like protein isoform X1 [Limanda limanda]
MNVKPSAEGEAMQRFGSEESEDDFNGRTFVEVIRERYSPENFPWCTGPNIRVVVVPREGPQGSSLKDSVNLPSVMVLDGWGVSQAGDQAWIEAFCAHVTKLDLSHNKLQDWHEINKIVSNTPNLESLNLSYNPLAGITLEPGCTKAFFGVRSLGLNNTKVSWDTVLLLIREIPELEELFLSLNGYSSLSAPTVACPSLRLLHITDNSLQDWAEVRKFSSMFPSLETLVMANNNLASIQDNKDVLQRLFPNLRSINLHNSGLNRWEDVEKLNFFPKLEEVQVQGIPLLQTFTEEERIHLVIAQLPAISWLNGSVVTDCEREAAERFFIRYYFDHPEEELPVRYHSLVTKYGKLEPLPEVDLRPRCCAHVEVHCEEKVQQLTIPLDQTVAGLKKQLTPVVQLSTSSMRLYYIDRTSVFGPEEMKFNTRGLQSYSIQDGDQLLVVPKTKRKAGVQLAD